MQLSIPDEAETDGFVRAVLGTFHLASRGRSYIGGMSVMPMPLNVKDITNVLDAHPVFVDRSILDPCIFAIDDSYLAELSSKNNDNEVR